jgi:spore maturation protein CgeB
LETLQIIKSRGDVATISWTTDDSWKYYEVSRFIGTAYHAMTTTYPDCVARYHQDGVPNVLLTQWAANSEMLQEPLPASLCRYKVSFVGAAHGDRKQRISELKSLGIEVNCFGHGWANGSVAVEEIPRIIQESVISLNFANAYKGPNQVKARTFEVPGSGGFLLTEYALGLEHCYIFDEEIAVFFSVEDLAEKIKYFLEYPEKRDVIAQAGFTRTKLEHTYDLRMKKLLDFAISSRDDCLKNNAEITQTSFEPVLAKYSLNTPLRLFRTLLILICTLIYGQKRGFRAARRLLFEAGWRLSGKDNFTASGLPGRLFPYQ